MLNYLIILADTCFFITVHNASQLQYFKINQYPKCANSFTQSLFSKYTLKTMFYNILLFILLDKYNLHRDVQYLQAIYKALKIRIRLSVRHIITVCVSTWFLPPEPAIGTRCAVFSSHHISF